MTASPRAEIGVFGGSGLYELLDDAEAVACPTPYGDPSDVCAVGVLGGRRVAFLPRHGSRHTIPPHRINYRANVAAMRLLGVRRILAPCAVGSLQAGIGPGAFVVPDQFVDRTHGRADTYVEGPPVGHVSAADPYCPELRAASVEAARAAGVRVQETGTLVVIQGPRFSSRAESRWYTTSGWDVIGMTGYPEVILARELGLCYGAIALVTDHDAGLEGAPDVVPVTHERVLQVFGENIARVRKVLELAIAALPPEPRCACHTAPAAAGLANL
ncbi:MAG TPA: S-methyl-5'-thioadenosine phosphorylase [Candidatus Micrarchaeia archaeon]|nr:S-methyl-5'-thioadenosine phosphorylase [Candidatus Micrarchaeia archaeon]